MRPLRLSGRQLQLLFRLLCLALVGTGVIVVTDDNPAPPPAATATPAPTAAPRSVTLRPELAGDHHDLAEHDARETTLPRGAARTAAIRGCTTALNTHNFSARPAGAHAQLITGHWTASRNVTGWADVDGNRNWLNLPTTRASANFIIDFEGHCAYTVPIELEAWTQKRANPYSVSIEFVATGTEPGLSARALAKGGLVISQVARRLGIPLQLGASRNCTPTREGLVDHKSYGPCGGGHPDLGTWSLAGLLAAARTAGITSTDRVTCRKLNWWRNAGRPHGHAEKNAIRRRDALEARGVRCTSSGPVLA